MDTATPGPAHVRTPLGIASFIAGSLAIVLSLGGQLVAARRLATDWNSGHPSADQPFMHAVSVAPSLILSILAIWIGYTACQNHRHSRKLAIVGVALGITSIALTFTNVLGSFAIHYWINPLPAER